MDHPRTTSDFAIIFREWVKKESEQATRGRPHNVIVAPADTDAQRALSRGNTSLGSLAYDVIGQKQLGTVREILQQLNEESERRLSGVKYTCNEVFSAGFDRYTGIKITITRSR